MTLWSRRELPNHRPLHFVWFIWRWLKDTLWEQSGEWDLFCKDAKQNLVVLVLFQFCPLLLISSEGAHVMAHTWGQRSALWHSLFLSAYIDSGLGTRPVRQVFFLWYHLACPKSGLWRHQNIKDITENKLKIRACIQWAIGRLIWWFMDWWDFKKPDMTGVETVWCWTLI